MPRSRRGSPACRAGSGGERRSPRASAAATSSARCASPRALVEPAEAMGHHPDLAISWDTVTVTISTHSEGGLTAADFELAEKIDALGTKGNEPGHGATRSSRRLLAVPIAVLCGCALVAIVLILGGSGVDDTSGRVLGTAAVPRGSLADGVSLLTRWRSGARGWRFWATSGSWLRVSRFLFGFGAIWDARRRIRDMARSLFGVAAVLAIAVAHASLLLANARPREGRMRCGSFATATLGALALLVIRLLRRNRHAGGRGQLARRSGYSLFSTCSARCCCPPGPDERLARARSRADRSPSISPVLGGGGGAVRECRPLLTPRSADLCGRPGSRSSPAPAPTQRRSRTGLLGASFRDPDGRLLELIAY